MAPIPITTQMRVTRPIAMKNIQINTLIIKNTTNAIINRSVGGSLRSNAMCEVGGVV